MLERDGIDSAILRRALSQRIESESLRAVARQVGMSPSGLQKFIAGGQPYTATRRRLERWYVRESAVYTAETTTESARAAITLLTRDVPQRERKPLMLRILAAIEDHYAAVGERPPKWLRDLKRS